MGARCQQPHLAEGSRWGLPLCLSPNDPRLYLRPTTTHEPPGGLERGSCSPDHVITVAPTPARGPWNLPGSREPGRVGDWSVY